MIKASRRSIFRGVFGRSGFELQLDTANEVLMRVNRSLDPIPLTERMWSSYLVVRRARRFSESDRMHAATSTESVLDVGAAVSHEEFRDFPAHVAKDLDFLLRLETLLRMWSLPSAADAGSVTSEQRRHQILAGLENEIDRYLGDAGNDDALPRDVVDEIVQYLAKAAGMI